MILSKRILSGFGIAFAVAACSSQGSIRTLGSSKSSNNDKKAKSDSTAVASGDLAKDSLSTETPSETREDYPQDNFDPGITAVPPQVVTGAYLVCATVDTTKPEAMAEMPAGYQPAANDVYSCGIQTSDYEKYPAAIAFQALAVKCPAEASMWQPGMDNAPSTSKWNVFFEVPHTRKCKFSDLNVDVEINGSPLSLETKLADTSKSVPPPAYHLIFVTSEKFSAGTAYPNGFDSLDAADKLCADQAAKGDVTSFKTEWKAILSSKAMPIRDRINVYADVLSTTMNVVYHSGNMWKKLLMPLADQFKAEIGEGSDEDYLVWTGSRSDGAKSPDTCSDWSNGTKDEEGKVGNPRDYSEDSWIDDSSIDCNLSARLYCISQYPAPPAGAAIRPLNP